MIWIILYIFCGAATSQGVIHLMKMGLIPFDNRFLILTIVWPVMWLTILWIYLYAFLQQRKEENKILKDVQKTLNRIKDNIDKKQDNE